MQKVRIISLISIITILLFGCEEVYHPKQKGYNRFDLPPHSYKVMNEKHPFTFEVSEHAEMTPHVSWLTEPHWIDLKYKSLNATVELTYKDLRKQEKGLESVLFDAHKLTNKHNIKAYAIDEMVVKTPKGYTASVFELEGEVPSQFQFFVTDSSKHFLRGALYFPVSTRNDSLSPAIEYIKKDMMHLINTLEWK